MKQRSDLVFLVRRNFYLLRTMLNPGHALLEKSLQRVIGVGTRLSVKETVLPWANRCVGVSFCPALPSPPLRRARSLAPTCPWYIRILDPTGKGSFVRACEESLQTCLFHSLESMRDSCSVGELIRRRPVLHGTAMFRPVVDDLLKITRYNYSFQNYRTCLA